jgi:hypothetical protein
LLNYKQRLVVCWQRTEQIHVVVFGIFYPSMVH